MVSFSLLVLVLIVSLVGGVFLLPESLLVALAGRTHGLGGRAPSQVDDPEALVELAEAYESNESFREALKYWTQYVEVTDDPEGIFRRARVLQKLDRHDRAMGDFLEIERDHSDLPSDYYFYRARSWRELDEVENALSDYESYFEEHPGAFEKQLEGARYAARLGRRDFAESWFRAVFNRADAPVTSTARLELAEFFVDDGDFSSAKKIVNALDETELADEQQKDLLFVKARIREEQGETKRAHEIYQTLYDRDPEFRNVELKIREHRATISDDNLLHEYKMLNREKFEECCRHIVRLMDYEPMETHDPGEEEVNVTARVESSPLMSMDKYLFAFKQWDGYVGVLPLKEFEMELLEGRFDGGFFVVPRGFKPSAVKYAEGSPKLTLIGPDRLVDFLRETL